MFTDKAVMKYPYTAPNGGPTVWAPDWIPTPAKVLFFAVCALQADFLSLWQYNGLVGRALIYPSGPGALGTDISNGAEVWRSPSGGFRQRMASKSTWTYVN